MKIQDEIHMALLAIEKNLSANIKLKDYHQSVLLLAALLEEEDIDEQ